MDYAKYKTDLAKKFEKVEDYFKILNAINAYKNYFHIEPEWNKRSIEKILVETNKAILITSCYLNYLKDCRKDLEAKFIRKEFDI